MGRKITAVSIFKGQHGVSVYQLGKELQILKGDKWVKLGKNVKKIKVSIFFRNAVTIKFSDNTKIVFKGFPFIVDYGEMIVEETVEEALPKIIDPTKKV